MNEEDIEKVEKLIKKCDECKLHECINCEINWTEIASVRRLIDGYKQLEEDYTSVYLSGFYDGENKWKSKIEEVIKKVNESNGFSPVNKILIEQVLNSILKIGG